MVGVDGEAREAGVLGGDGAPDLAAVESVARFALAALRRGQRVILTEVAPELAALIGLAALPVEVEAEGLIVEVEGQPEGREQALRVEEVQEEGHLGDLPT